MESTPIGKLIARVREFSAWAFSERAEEEGEATRSFDSHVTLRPSKPKACPED